MNHPIVRIIVSAMVFLAFSWISTVCYMKFINDVGATYWAMGVFGLPVVLLIVWRVDIYLKKLSFFQSNYGLLTTIDALLGLAIYYPSLFLVMLTVKYILQV